MINHWFKALFLILLSLSAWHVAAAESVVLNRVTTPQPMGLYLDYLEDPSGKLSILDIIDNSANLPWQTHTRETPNFGYTYSAYWFRLSVENTGDTPTKRLLEIGYPLLDYLEFFKVSGHLISDHVKTGDRHAFDQRVIEHRHFLFPVSLNPGEQADIYLRVRSESSLQVPIRFASEVAFYTNDQNDLIQKSVYYGMMTVMIMFNLFLYLSLREKVYLYYICFVFSFLMVQLSLHGMPSQYFWPDYPYLQDFCIVFFVPCIVLFASLFTRYFLSLKNQAPRIDLFFKIAGWISLANIAGAFILNYEASVKLSITTVVPVSLACLITGPYLWLKGYTIARFYSLAWFSITLAALILAFNKFGLIPRTFLTENGLYFGSALEAILLSLALADRLNSERTARFKAQEKVLMETRQRQLAEEKLIYSALHNPLTDTPNRTYFENWFSKKSKHRKLQKPLLLGMIHLRRFHEVNKTLGHLQADEFLKLITRRLNQWAAAIPGSIAFDGHNGQSHHIIVIEGVTFVMLVDPIQNPKAYEAIEELTGLISEPIEFSGLMIDIGGVAGTAQFPRDAKDAPNLIRNAQIAIDMGGHSGTLVTPYSEAINPYNSRRLTLAGELRKAISSDGLELYFQPKVAAMANKATGMEALLRWHHPEHGFIPPDEFIPIAEQTGIIHPLTHWVIDNAVSRVAELSKHGLKIAVAVNISAINLKEKHFPDRVRSILDKHGVDPSQLAMEVTETAMMDDQHRALAVLKRLNLLGVRLAIDDFGTGYSSLAYIKQLPVQEIKIDRSFIMDMDKNAGDAIIVRTMVNMCHDLGYDVVAEGVETDDSCNSLRAMGCDYLQGYYLSRPLPYDQFLEWMQKEVNLV